MTYLDVLTDICSQIGDPELDTYKERAKDHFVRAIFSLIDQDKYTPDDIPGYVKYKTDLTFDNNEYDLTSPISVYKIIKVFMPPGTSTAFTVSQKTPDQLARISSNDQLQPTDNELFVYRIGNILYLLTSSGTNYADENLALIYMQDIDTSSWNDGDNLTSGKFSQSFVRRAITLAVQTLIQEDSTNK